MDKVRKFAVPANEKGTGIYIGGGFFAFKGSGDARYILVPAAGEFGALRSLGYVDQGEEDAPADTDGIAAKAAKAAKAT